MKKCLFFITGFILSELFTFGQSGKQGLSVGDEVPDIVITNIIQYPPGNDSLTTIRLNNLKGKIILLDFWATWCSPCVQGLPKLDSLQRKFKDRLVVLPVSNEPEATVRRFFQVRKHLRLPSAIDTNNNLNEHFPHNIIPHAVLISPEGKVAAITNSSRINDSLITAILNGRRIDMPIKKDIQDYNHEKPLLLNGNGSTGNDSIIFRSMVTPYEPGLSSHFSNITNREKIIGFHYVNHFLTQLYLYSIGESWLYWMSRCFYERNGILFPYYDSIVAYEDRTLEWLSQNVYTYDIVAPELQDKERYQYMQREVSALFKVKGLKVVWEKRKLPCLLLTVANSSMIKTNGNMQHRGHNAENDTITWQNIPVKDLPELLEPLCHLPVLDETGYNGNVDISFKSGDFKEYGEGAAQYNLQLYNQLLRQRGLQLVPSKRRISVMIMKYE